MFILELLKKQELEALRFLNDPSNICIDSYNNEYLDCALDNQIISYIHSDVLWVLNSNETDFITFESNKMRITFEQNIVDKHTVVSYFFLKIKESIELSISLAQRHFQQNNQDLIKTLKKHPMILSNLLLLSEYFSLDTFFIDSSKNVDNSYFYFAVIDEDRIKFISFDDYELQAKKKRIYEQFVVEMYEYYIQRGYLSSKLIILNTWLAVKVEKIDNMDFLDSIDLGRITDYIMSDYFIPEFDKLHKMNIEDVFIKAKEWETRNQNKKFKESKNDIEVVIKEDNYSLVKLKTTNALKRESSQMGHCVGNGGYDHSVNKGHIEIYSLRDQSNQSIATIEYIKEQKKINQIKGKKNKAVEPEWHAILQYLVLVHFKCVTTDDCNDATNIGLEKIKIFDNNSESFLASKENSLELTKYFPLRHPLCYKVDDYSVYLDGIIKANPSSSELFSKFVRVKLENNKNLSVFQGRYLQEKQIKFYKKIEEIEDKFFNLIKHCDVDFSSLAILKNGKKEEFLLDTLNFVRKFVLNIEYHEQFKIKYLKTPKNIDKYLIFLKYLVRECSKANLFIKNEFFDIMLYIKAKTYNTYDYKDWHSVIMTPELRMYENKCMNTTTISLYLDKMANDITYSPTAMIISDPLYSKLSKIIQLYHNNLKGYKNYIEPLFNSIYNENGELVKTRVSASSSPVYIAYSIDIEPVIEIVDEYIKNKNLSFDFDKIKLELLELNRLEEQFTQQELKTNHLLYWKDN